MEIVTMINNFFELSLSYLRNTNPRALLKRLFCLACMGLAALGSGIAVAKPMTTEQPSLEDRVNQVRQRLQGQSENITTEGQSKISGDETVAQWPNWPNWPNYFRNY
jgi:hypothetical protein